MSLDPNHEDEQVPAQQPPKFTKKSNSDSDMSPKHENVLNGLAGDTRRRLENCTTDNNNQIDSRYEKHDSELTKAGAWISSNAKNASLGDLLAEDRGHKSFDNY